MAEKSKPQALNLSAASAAFVSSGIGCLVIGLMVTLAEMSTGIKDALNWWSPAGPLSGKTGIGILAWLVSWALLHTMWKNKDVDFDKMLKVSMALIGVGFLLTFPPVFVLFAAE